MKHVINLINQQIKASAECKARLLINPKKYKEQISICTEEIKQYKASLLILSGVVDSMPMTQDFIKKLISKIENNHKGLDELSKTQMLLGGKYVFRIINDLKKQD